MALLSLPGAEAVLTAHAPSLPQPDQLCGPFSARLALHAVLPASEVPSLSELASAAGTAIWPYDLLPSRPAGAPMDSTGWEALPRAASPHSSGTDAAGLIEGLEATVGQKVCVVPVPGAQLTTSRLRSLLSALARAEYRVGVLANLRTGPIAVSGSTWDVGHFVVLTAVDDERGDVTVADTYAELTGPGMPTGCRQVALTALAEALAAPPGRGLVLLVRTEDRAAAIASVTAAGLAPGPWST